MQADEAPIVSIVSRHTPYIPVRLTTISVPGNGIEGIRNSAFRRIETKPAGADDSPGTRASALPSVARGTVNADGATALPPGVELAPGTTVRVELPDKPACPSGAPERVGSRPLRVSGRVKDAPVDWAANHDHYLHGGPTRE